MSSCHLIIDSCCDLPPQVVDRPGVTLMKFPYTMDGGTFEDDLFATASAEDFYNAMRKGSEPTTAQVSLATLTDTFTAAAKEGTPAVYLAFSSGLSASFDAACVVRDQVLADYPDFELHIVDTRLASVAEGLLVYGALVQHEKGMSAAELAAWAEEARCFVNEEFMVEDLEALRRGGRIPASVAVAGAALDVKPLLNIGEDGRLALTGVARGRKKGIKSLVDYYKKNVDSGGPSHTAIIGHADCPKDAQRLRELLEKEDPGIMILECSIGPVIGSHVGAGMVAVVFWGRDKRDNLSVADRIARKVKGDK
ncbi:MAG: DegV family protein [Adlercreutzia sp.]|uniref:DegV family protein n=1 Tax=uncultured Adlercreutzia sp. TaxID=875803 RepID=UPI00216BE280|nr:DegV family protein [uncultured Adlercreutzia sp.]MCI8424283.1 DegV family protein [Adlercreutzia sp.]